MNLNLTEYEPNGRQKSSLPHVDRRGYVFKDRVYELIAIHLNERGVRSPLEAAKQVLLAIVFTEMIPKRIGKACPLVFVLGMKLQLCVLSLVQMENIRQLTFSIYVIIRVTGSENVQFKTNSPFFSQLGSQSHPHFSNFPMLLTFRFTVYTLSLAAPVRI